MPRRVNAMLYDVADFIEISSYILSLLNSCIVLPLSSSLSLYTFLEYSFITLRQEACAL